jgi:hypothetical protein
MASGLAKGELPAGLVERDVRTVAAIALAVIGPMPGIVANRRLASLARCHATIRFSIRAISPRTVRS